MKKIKILIVVLTFSLFATGNIFVAAKSLEQNKTKELKIKKEENIVNNLTEKEKEKFYVKDYIIKQVIKKGIFTIVHYEHKKSGAQILVFFDNLKYIDIDPQNGEFSEGKIFIKCNPPVNAVILEGMCSFLNKSLEKGLNSEYSEEELRQLGFFYDEYFKVADFNKGCGIYLNFSKYDKNIFKCITNAIKHPLWYKDKKFVDSTLKAKKEYLKLIKNTYKVLQNITLNPELYDRFSFGKFSNCSKLEELEKLKKNEEFLYKTHNKIFNPSNFLIKINGNKNPNYKEIMKDINKNCFFNFENKEKINKTNEEKILENITKKPYREIEINSNNVLTENQISYFEDLGQNSAKNCKYKAKLFWDVSKIPEKERVIFLTNPEVYWNFLKEEIKNMGYIGVVAQTYDDYITPNSSIMFDGLYYIDIFGSNKKYFTKEKLEENGKKLVKMLYEKIKNISDKEILNSVYYDETLIPEFEDCLNYRNSCKYLKCNFDDFYTRSYCLTHNPFNKKYYNFKNNREIEFKTKDFVDSFKKYNNKFEVIFNNKPNYIDIFIANKKNEEENKKYNKYLNPLYENERSETKINDIYIAPIIDNIIYDEFYKPNLIDKGLIAKGIVKNTVYLEIRQENLAEVEKYFFKKFKKEIENFLPKEAEINKYKTLKIKDLQAQIKKYNKFKEEYEDVLNSSNKFKQYEEKFKKEQFRLYKIYKAFVKSSQKKIKERKLNSKKIKFLKDDMKDFLEYIKDYEKNVKKPNYFSDEVRKYLNDRIKSMKFNIKKDNESIKTIKNLTYEDFVNYIKSLRFSSANNLKKCENSEC